MTLPSHYKQRAATTRTPGPAARHEAAPAAAPAVPEARSAAGPPHHTSPRSARAAAGPGQLGRLGSGLAAPRNRRSYGHRGRRWTDRSGIKGGGRRPCAWRGVGDPRPSRSLPTRAIPGFCDHGHCDPREGPGPTLSPRGAQHPPSSPPVPERARRFRAGQKVAPGGASRWLPGSRPSLLAAPRTGRDPAGSSGRRHAQGAEPRSALLCPVRPGLAGGAQGSPGSYWAAALGLVAVKR